MMFPLSDYTISVVIYVLLATALVITLLGGGLLVLNLGLLSKRPEDRTGHRAPSDLGILKTTTWPEETENRPSLPAEEDADPEPRPPDRRAA